MIPGDLKRQRPAQLAPAELRQLAAVRIRATLPDLPPQAASVAIDAIDAAVAALLLSLGLSPWEASTIADVLWARGERARLPRTKGEPRHDQHLHYLHRRHRPVRRAPSYEEGLLRIALALYPVSPQDGPDDPAPAAVADMLLTEVPDVTDELRRFVASGVVRSTVRKSLAIAEIVRGAEDEVSQ